MRDTLISFVSLVKKFNQVSGGAMSFVEAVVTWFVVGLSFSFLVVSFPDKSWLIVIVFAIIAGTWAGVKAITTGKKPKLVNELTTSQHAWLTVYFFFQQMCGFCLAGYFFSVIYFH